jgi:hypothetical protein
MPHAVIARLHSQIITAERGLGYFPPENDSGGDFWTPLDYSESSTKWRRLRSNWRSKTLTHLGDRHVESCLRQISGYGNAASQLHNWL